MSDFERDIVHCLNRFLATRHRQGFAYRLKQHAFSSQYVDVLVDSFDPTYCLAIECKSITDKNSISPSISILTGTKSIRWTR